MLMENLLFSAPRLDVLLRLLVLSLLLVVLLLVIVVEQFLTVAASSLVIVHIAEVPCHLEIDHGVAPVLLVTPEGVALGIVLPMAGLKHITPVEGNGKFLVEEVLADTQVEGGVRLAIALCDDATRAVVACQLHRDIVRQDEGGEHAGIP